MPLWQPDTPHGDVLFVPQKTLHTVEKTFHSDHYLRHNQRRLEHLASLGLQLQGKRVLEVGAGVGDHTSFYLDRDCWVVVTDARIENLAFIRRKFGENKRVEVAVLDMEDPQAIGCKFDLVHCYGLIYHLQNPEKAIEFLSSHCEGTLLLETCVSVGSESAINPIQEPSHNFSQSFYGTGCRPTHPWLWDILSRLFQYVYVPRTQASP